MKITKEDYTRLEKLIHETVEKNPTAQAAYIAKGLTQVRFIWDTWNVTIDRTMREKVEDYLWLRGLHDYLNDSHLETALKAIIGPYTQPESPAEYKENEPCITLTSPAAQLPKVTGLQGN